MGIREKLFLIRGYEQTSVKRKVRSDSFKQDGK